MQLKGCVVPVKGGLRHLRSAFLSKNNPVVVWARPLTQSRTASSSNSNGEDTRKDSSPGTHLPSNYDLIGPADPVSNIRPIRFYIPEGESKLHRKVRLLRQDTLKFHQDFWTEHNTIFVESREKFVTKLLKEKYPHEVNKKTISTEEMSQFYKAFLDSQWSAHLKYNLEWQQRNFKIAAFSFVVGVENILRRI